MAAIILLAAAAESDRRYREKKRKTYDPQEWLGYDDSWYTVKKPEEESKGWSLFPKKKKSEKKPNELPPIYIKLSTTFEPKDGNSFQGRDLYFFEKVYGNEVFPAVKMRWMDFGIFSEKRDELVKEGEKTAGIDLKKLKEDAYRISLQEVQNMPVDEFEKKISDGLEKHKDALFKYPYGLGGFELKFAEPREEYAMVNAIKSDRIHRYAINNYGDALLLAEYMSATIKELGVSYGGLWHPDHQEFGITLDDFMDYKRGLVKQRIFGSTADKPADEVKPS